jgi:hypothetical protein
MAKEDPTVITVTLIGGPEDGLTVDVRASWNAYRPPNARGAYKKSGTRWQWVPDKGLR